MSVVTVDNTNFTAVLEDAGIAQESKPEPKDDPSQKEHVESKKADDDEEDENGLTASDRQALTEKMQRVIGKKHRAMREAEEFAAAQYNTAQLAQKRAQELESEISKFQTAKPAEPVKAPEKPNRINFGTESEYLDATIQWGVEQELAKREAQRARDEEARRQKEIQNAAIDRLNKAREMVEDFDEVCSKVDTIVPDAVAGYMQKSEMFAELGYYFAKNPEILVSLAKLPHDEQLVKIGKIEDKLQPFGSKTERSTNGTQIEEPRDSTGKPPSKSRSSMATVITPLGDGGSAGVQKDPAEMNIRETIQHWSKTNSTNLTSRKRH